MPVFSEPVRLNGAVVTDSIPLTCTSSSPEFELYHFENLLLRLFAVLL